jgi:P27 family predicted phage terminase small subunit
MTKGTKPHLVVINGTAVEHFPSAPDWMSTEAKAEWRRVQPLLEQRKFLTEIDMSNLENYCVSQGRVRECEAMLMGVNDIDRKAKIWRMQKQAMDAARQLGAELGLTPMSRSRPTMQKSLFDDDDDLVT